MRLRKDKLIIEMVAPYFIPYRGGIENVVYNLAVGLGKRGHKVYIHTSITTPIHKNLPKLEKHKYYTIKRYREYPYALIFPSFYSKDSILSLHNYSCLMNDWIALRYPNKKKVLSPYGNITYERSQRYHKNLSIIYDKFIGKRTLFNVNIITAMTNLEKNGIIKKFPMFKNKVSIIAAGLNFKTNISYKKKPFNFPYFISVGRITPTKHFDNVLKILKHFPKFHYVIAGQDFNHIAELLNLAKELGLEKRFHYMGEVSEERKIQLLHYGSLFIMPDSANAFGIANLEGFYYLGKVVAAKAGGMTELTKEFGGEVFSVGDLNGLKNAIKKTLAKKQSLKQKKQLQTAIKQKYSWDTVVDAYEKVLLSIT